MPLSLSPRVYIYVYLHPARIRRPSFLFRATAPSASVYIIYTTIPARGTHGRLFTCAQRWFPVSPPVAFLRFKGGDDVFFSPCVRGNALLNTFSRLCAVVLLFFLLLLRFRALASFSFEVTQVRTRFFLLYSSAFGDSFCRCPGNRVLCENCCAIMEKRR